MKKILIGGVVIALLILGWVFYRSSDKKPVQATSVAPALVDCSSFDERIMLEEINSVREHKLVVDPYLEILAQERADKMPYELDDHVGFRLLNDRLLQYNYVGEILASNKCFSARTFFIQWKNSPSHWESINDERFDSLGIGFNTQGTAVVIFGDK